MHYEEDQPTPEPRGARRFVLCSQCSSPAAGGDRPLCIEHLALAEATAKVKSPTPPLLLPAAPALAPCSLCRNRRYQITADVSGMARAHLCQCAAECRACTKGWFFIEGRGVSPCACTLRSRRLARFNLAGIPALYAERLTGPLSAPSGYAWTPSQAAAQKTVEAWAKSYQLGARGLVLWGGFGSGKTTLLARALAYVTLATQSDDGRFAEWGLLLQGIKESWDGESASPLEGLYKTPLLVLDELGRHLATPWQTGQLEHLLQARYQAKLPTLYATNHKPDELRERIGQRLYERLIERCDFIEVQGSSLRLHQPPKTPAPTTKPKRDDHPWRRKVSPRGES